MPVIETSLGRIAEPDGDRVEFIVRTDVPAYQARLPKMGGSPAARQGRSPAAWTTRPARKRSSRASPGTSRR
jgi:hypothetical protein